MNKIFCFDIDGTLRDNVNHEVSSSTKLALDTLKEMGYKLIISTGRAYDSLKRTKINELIDWDGFVLNNGQLLLDHNENVIEEKAFDPSTVIEVIKRADELNYAVTLKKEKRTITKEPDEYVKTTQAYFNNVIGPVEKYDGHEDVWAMIIYGPMGYDYAPFLDIEGCNVLPGMSCYADVSIKGVSKAKGCQYFVDHFQSEGYVAFGDSQNDLEMFKYADISICMGNGDELAKKRADYITDDINNDGILHALQHFNWIKE
jgi:Cof subfamily protein (haloacid dehalogenase superfamily)